MSSTQRCHFVPPYLLEALARSDEPAVAEPARRALEHDAGLRRGRRQTPSARATGIPARIPAPAPATAAAAATGPKRTIYDAKGGMTRPGTQVRAEGEPATGEPATDEAYDGLGATWELFWTAYGRDSLDGDGMPLLATVHYGLNYDNAFWDGSQMVFGDGDGIVFVRFTKSLDVIGHELTHGVTEHTAGLRYQGQPGALNESISDVFGILVRQRALGQSVADADWIIGADLLAPGVKGRAIRDMQHPGTAYDDPRLGKDPQPASMADYVVTSDDNGGVHINSGIPNRAFALAALGLGGNAWETVGPIWYAVLDGPGIKADCDFATFADLTVAAAAQAHGDGSAQHGAVRAAWIEVGVLTDGGDPGGGTGPADRSWPETQTPSGPAHGEVPGVDADLLIRRTGGFAGRVREARMVLGELPQRDTLDWQHLLAAPTLQRIAAEGEPPHPDAFCYDVVCAQVDMDLRVAEPHLPEAIHQLFERTLDFRAG